MQSRRIFESIMYVLRTGCQWEALLKEIYGSPSAIHAHFMRWMDAGFSSPSGEPALPNMILKVG